MLEMLDEISLSEGLLSDISFGASKSETGRSFRTPGFEGDRTKRQCDNKTNRSFREMDQSFGRTHQCRNNVESKAGPGSCRTPEPEVNDVLRTSQALQVDSNKQVFRIPEMGRVSLQPEVSFLRPSQSGTIRQQQRSNNSSHR